MGVGTSKCLNRDPAPECAVSEDPLLDGVTTSKRSRGAAGYKRQKIVCCRDPMKNLCPAVDIHRLKKKEAATVSKQATSRGFKASLNLGSGKSHGIEHYDKSPGVSLIGAYRTNKDEQFGNIRITEQPKKITSTTIRPSAKGTGPTSNHSKSTNNLTKPSNEENNFRKSSPNITQAMTNQTPKIDTKKQKELEKKRIAEQVKQEKLAAKQRLQEEKMRKEREKNIQRTKLAEDQSTQKKVKKRAPQPQQIAQEMNTTSRSKPQLPQHSTNTLESSISKSSGPPPYSSHEIAPNQNDNTGNTSFVKPVDDMSSWDIISQHREQMNRQRGVSKNIPKQTHLDLNYNVGSSSSSNGNINSNA